jgi:chromosome partitioning protein
MKIWAVSNQKGGVGKTTTVVSLGGLLSSWGFRTLLVDLDPHYFMIRGSKKKILALDLT